MSPAEYSAAADRIRATRSLQTYQRFDLALQERLVRQRGSSTALDDYYLEICGIPIVYRQEQKIMKCGLCTYTGDVHPTMCPHGDWRERVKPVQGKLVF